MRFRFAEQAADGILGVADRVWPFAESELRILDTTIEGCEGLIV